MSDGPLLPTGEQLRRAVAWLAEQSRCDGAAIEAAARRFDLTPAEEEFLLTHFRQPPGPGPARSAG
jgi:hypothetical protein